MRRLARSRSDGLVGLARAQRADHTQLDRLVLDAAGRPAAAFTQFAQYLGPGWEDPRDDTLTFRRLATPTAKVALPS